MNEKTIADRITELRMKRDISEYRLSHDLGMSKSYIGTITSGLAFPSIPMFLEICDYFDVSPAEFFAPEYDKQAKKLVSRFESLNDEHKELVTKMIEVMINMQKEDD